MCSRPLGLALVIAISACEPGRSLPEPAEPCSPSWYEAVEARLPTRDPEQHGPDLGSSEWRGVVEFKLGVRDQPSVPDRESREWCEFIDRILREKQP